MDIITIEVIGMIYVQVQIGGAYDSLLNQAFHKYECGGFEPSDS